MKKLYSVAFNAFGSCTVKVEASSPEEALKLARDEADLSEGELYDFDMECPGEVLDMGTGEAFDILELEK
jgi:hypothetical protein